MKKMVCEICGSQSIRKENGVFTCQECGTEYSVEEAKRLLVEVNEEQKEIKEKNNSEKSIDDLLTSIYSWINYVELIDECGLYFGKYADDVDAYNSIICSDDCVIPLDYFNHFSKSALIEKTDENRTKYYLDYKICKDSPHFTHFYVPSYLSTNDKIKYGLPKEVADLLTDYVTLWEKRESEKNGPIKRLYDYYMSYKEYIYSYERKPISSPVTPSLFAPLGYKNNQYYFYTFNEYFIYVMDVSGNLDAAEQNPYFYVGCYGKWGLFGFSEKGMFDKTKVIGLLREGHDQLGDSYEQYYKEIIRPQMENYAEKINQLIAYNKEMESMLFVPYKYRNAKVLSAFAELIIDGRASSFKEAMNLMEEDSFRQKVLDKLDNIEGAILRLGNIIKDSADKINTSLLKMNHNLELISKDVRESTKKLGKIQRTNFITMYNTL